MRNKHQTPKYTVYINGSHTQGAHNSLAEGSGSSQRIAAQRAVENFIRNYSVMWTEYMVNFKVIKNR